MTASISVRGSVFVYFHSHDLAGIIETTVLDVYRRRLLRRGDVVLDVGAGIGDFAITAAKAVGSEGIVVAVEPSPADFAALKQNIALNHLNNVSPQNCAIGRDERSVQLSFKNALFSATVVPVRKVMSGAFESIKGVTPRINFVKIDVEGMEEEVLLSLEPFLEDVRGIAIELHQTREKADSILATHGFEFRQLTRSEYIANASFFAMRHPVQTARLWKLFKGSGEYPGIGKMLRGIEISKGEQLSVGVYEKVNGSP